MKAFYPYLNKGYQYPIMHILANARWEVHTFLLGTRLPNVESCLKVQDVEHSLEKASGAVNDWSGIT